jgi:hypothetical protein
MSSPRTQPAANVSLEPEPTLPTGVYGINQKISMTRVADARTITTVIDHHGQTKCTDGDR